MTSDTENELWRLTDNCTVKRVGLLRYAATASRQRRRYSMLAGILALISAGSVTSLLSDYANSQVMKFVAVGFSTASGFISLLNSVTAKDSEIQQVFQGASKYLSLRDRCQRLLINSDLTARQQWTVIDEIHKAYAELDGAFMRYLEDTQDDRFSSAPRRTRDILSVQDRELIDAELNELRAGLRLRKGREAESGGDAGKAKGDIQGKAKGDIQH